MSDSVLNAVLPAVRRRIAQTVARTHLPGAAAGIVRDQALAWSEGFGFADIDSGRRPDADTIYRVASISKTFTATAIMQLRDAGALHLDDPLVRHLPEFEHVRFHHGRLEDITIRRLLSHHTGLLTEGPFDYWQTYDFPPMEAILERLPVTEVVIEPHSAFKYGNLAYALLGEVVARRSGRPFVEYAHDELLKPLGMDSSTFDPLEVAADRLATGYQPHPFEDTPEPVAPMPINGIAAAAGLYTTVRDLGRWIALQFRQDAPERSGSQVLRGPSLAEMHRPQHVDPTWTSGYGLCWMSMRRGERIFVGHGGSVPGFITRILFSVPTRTGVIVLTNEGQSQVANDIAVEMLETIVAAHEEAGATPSGESPVPTPSEWKSLLGRYRAWGGVFHVECRAGSLMLMPFPPGVPGLHAPARLAPEGQPGRFRPVEGRGAGELLTFEFAPDGSVLGFTLAGFRYARLVDAPV